MNIWESVKPKPSDEVEEKTYSELVLEAVRVEDIRKEEERTTDRNTLGYERSDQLLESGRVEQIDKVVKRIKELVLERGDVDVKGISKRLPDISETIVSALCQAHGFERLLNRNTDELSMYEMGLIKGCIGAGMTDVEIVEKFELTNTLFVNAIRENRRGLGVKTAKYIKTNEGKTND
jgi:hypothetical protein